ncbi:MAG: hypothetical protein LUF04_10405, partial [Bacteroides sp.]|nr:hypothetical protein [Bacteroides sp.]
MGKTEQKVKPIWESGKEKYDQAKEILENPFDILEKGRILAQDTASEVPDWLGLPNGEETREGWFTPLFNIIGQAGEWISDLLENGEEKMTSILDIISGAYDQARDVLEDPFGSLREWTAQAPAWIDQILDAVGIPEGNRPTEITEQGLPEEITGTPESIEMGTIQAETQQAEEPAHIRSFSREPWSPLRTLAAA